jgi:sugar/nucleoside kinase (ribokinase family)
MLSVAKTWSEQHTCLVIVTQSEQGATLFLSGKSEHIPTRPVPKNLIVSSVGAGDIFSAGFMYAFRKKSDPAAAVRFANALAGQCLTADPEHIVIDISSLPKIK